MNFKKRLTSVGVCTGRARRLGGVYLRVVSRLVRVHTQVRDALEIEHEYFKIESVVPRSTAVATFDRRAT